MLALWQPVYLSYPSRFPSAPCCESSLQQQRLLDRRAVSFLPLGLQPDGVLPHHSLSREVGVVERKYNIINYLLCVYSKPFSSSLKGSNYLWGWTIRLWILGTKLTAPQWGFICPMSRSRGPQWSACSTEISSLRLSVDSTYMAAVSTFRHLPPMSVVTLTQACLK